MRRGDVGVWSVQSARRRSLLETSFWRRDSVGNCTVTKRRYVDALITSVISWVQDVVLLPYYGRRLEVDQLIHLFKSNQGSLFNIGLTLAKWRRDKVHPPTFKKRLALGILKTSTITRHIDVGSRLATWRRPIDVVKTSRAGHLKDVVKLSVKQNSWL